MRVKPGVKFDGIQAPMLRALAVAEEIYADFKKTLTVTSVRDGKHMRGSLHESGLAVDLRTVTAGIDGTMARAMMIVLKARLGADYDVVVEPDHIHLEFDPKAKAVKA